MKYLSTLLVVAVYFAAVFSEADDDKLCVPTDVCLSSSFGYSYQYQCVYGQTLQTIFHSANCTGIPLSQSPTNYSSCVEDKPCKSYVTYRYYQLSNTDDEHYGFNNTMDDLDDDDDGYLSCNETVRGHLKANTSVAFEFIPSGTVEFIGCNSSFDTVFYIYSADNLSHPIAQNDDSYPCRSIDSYIMFDDEDTAYNGSYYFVIEGYSDTDSGNFTFFYFCDVMEWVDPRQPISINMSTLPLIPETTESSMSTSWYPLETTGYVEVEDPDPNDECVVDGYFDAVEPVGCTNYENESVLISCTESSVAFSSYIGTDCVGEPYYVQEIVSGCTEQDGYLMNVEILECMEATTVSPSASPTAEVVAATETTETVKTTEPTEGFEESGAFRICSVSSVMMMTSAILMLLF